MLTKQEYLLSNLEFISIQLEKLKLELYKNKNSNSNRIIFNGIRYWNSERRHTSNKLIKV